jgi:cathepsin L
VAKNSGLLYNLSPQQIASCSPNPEQCGGSGGCEGATYDVSFGYATDATHSGGGLYSEYQYAYNSYYGQDYDCKTLSDPVAGINGYTTLASNNYTQLMNAVAQVGPVAVVVDASAWGTYKEGVFDGCDTESPDINHGVVVVGYGVCEKHGPYWLIRNSWSPSWGEAGYIKLRRSDNDASNCAMDTTPQDGTACAGDDTPQKVCGSCGVLFNSVLPYQATAFDSDEHRKP